jgi:hypothetical protein
MKNELDFLLERQHLIIGYNKQKLEIVNHIHEGYTNNNRLIIKSDFLFFAAHVFYRSVVIDLCALFGQGSGHKNNLYQLYKNRDILKYLKPDVPGIIKAMIKKHSKEIKKIIALRNGEYAHYDFDDKPVIHMNFDELAAVNDLFTAAQNILLTCGKEKADETQNTHYELSDRDYLNSLMRLIQPAISHLI